MPGSERASLKTLLIGVDAACRSVLDPLVEAGAVPHLASILEDGASGELESQIPPWTPSAWPSLYTGANPGKHGVFSFLRFEGYDWDVVNSTDVRERTLWELLDHHDRSSVVVNAPVTHPPREIEGAIVPGYTAPEDPDCHPEGLLSEIREEIGDYRVYAPRDVSEEEKVEWYRRLVEMRGEAFGYLVERFEPEFGFVQFQQTDTVFHEFPGDDEKVRAVYEAVDEQVGEILEQCDPDTVVLASDHGIGEYTGYEFRPNVFLRERGLVETTAEGEGMPTWSTIADNRLREGEEGKSDERESGPSLERAMGLAARVGLTSQRIGAVLERTGLAEFVAERVPEDVIRAGSELVDFPASRAYMRDRIELGIRVNLRGREPEGVVPKSEYEQVRDDLVAMLSTVETPDGKPVFEQVLRREEVFSGPHVERAPDVITVPNDYDQFLSAQLRDEPFGEPREPYNHKLMGIVALASDGIDASADLSEAHLLDVAPTVLATLGLPAAEHMDGDPLSVVESPGVEQYPEYEPVADAATDSSAVEARLTDMGYLE